MIRRGLIPSSPYVEPPLTTMFLPCGFFYFIVDLESIIIMIHLCGGSLGQASHLGFEENVPVKARGYSVECWGT